VLTILDIVKTFSAATPRPRHIDAFLHCTGRFNRSKKTVTRIVHSIDGVPMTTIALIQPAGITPRNYGT